MNTTSVILAAGHGIRMRSALPKVLHPILGKPMIWHALQSVKRATQSKPVVVVGYSADEVRKTVGEEANFVIQEQRLGTGHAVLQSESLLSGKTDCVLVTYADMPLLTVDTLSTLVQAHERFDGPISMITVEVDSPRGFGRVIRNSHGNVQAIIEEVQATPEQLDVRELNVGVYCFSAEWLWDSLKHIPLSPKGEYYLTELVSIAVSDGLKVQAIRSEHPSEMIGVNNRVHLAEATALLKQRVNKQWMLDGVTLIDPAMTYIESGISIGEDTVIWPNTYLQGETQIGETCILGPDVIIRDTKVGNNCRILASVLENAVMEDDVDIGPFGHLRKGAHLAQGVHMGNFGEVKESYLGPGTKMGHYSYIGNANIGANVNIGAGTITCNYDGKEKHKTEIGSDVFIGSDTMLVAPISLGNNSRTGAGSVVTKNVQTGTLVVGMPARAIRKLDET